MPELPEVETTRRGIAPWLEGERLRHVVIRQPSMRWPVPSDLPAKLRGAKVRSVDRRGKYLLLRTDRGTVLLHLGMSGSLRVLREPAAPATLHDHADLVTAAGTIIRFNDPRRFGSLLWTEGDPAEHPLIAELGPEPLDPAFDGAYLHAASRGRTIAIKPHLMNSRVVVGVGNIYASEALFRAGIHPGRAAGRISAERMERLARAIKDVLSDAIRAGGTTLRDFHNGEGLRGYFSAQLRVYDRAGHPCIECGTAVRHRVMGQRSTYYCPGCQR